MTKPADMPATPRRAGMRYDELAPGQEIHPNQVGDEATGSPEGGLGTSGIAGLPTGTGAPGNAELTREEDPAEPQSGPAGGAVGGTPANKRTRGK